MSDLREKLLAKGWKQGVILEPVSLPSDCVVENEGAVGFLVLTQTCDCINPSFEKEPTLELLPLVPRKTKKRKPDPNCQNGKNPREIHFWITFRGEQMCAVSRIKDIQLMERELIEDFDFSKEIIISRETIDDIIEWRAARYSRTAFPEGFEGAFSTISDGFGEIMARHESVIDSLLISISPFDEIEEGDCYEIEMHLMVTPSVMGQPETIEALKKSATEIGKLFATSSFFDSPKCSVTCLDEMTLWNARKLLDFSRYDYLSFGQAEESP